MAYGFERTTTQKSVFKKGHTLGRIYQNTPRNPKKLRKYIQVENSIRYPDEKSTPSCNL